MKRVNRLFLTIFVLALVLVLAPSADLNAATSFKYKDYNTGKYVKYTGVIPGYVINGVSANLSKEPALISERGIAYASANGLFRDVIGMKVKYYKSKKQIKFTYNGHVLLMKLDSDIATFDGSEVEVPCRPFRIKYKKSKIIATMVPSRFVAEAFGINYTWNSDAGEVTMDIPFTYVLNGETINYTGTRGRIMFNGESVDFHDAPSLIMSDTAMISTESDLFKTAEIGFEYDKKSGIITLAHGENVIIFCVGSKIAYVNGLIRRTSYPPTVFGIPSTGHDILYIPGRFAMENLGFCYEWNSATGTSEICTPDVCADDPETENDGAQDDGDKTGGQDASSTEDKAVDTEGSGNKATEEDPENEKANSGETDTENGSGSENTGDVENTGDIENTGNTGSENTGDEDEDDGETDTEETKPKLPLELINVYNTIEGYKFFIDKDNCIQHLTFPVPEGVTAKDFDMHEDILGCLTELSVKGNYSEFYNDALVENTGEAILQIQVYYDPNTDETLVRIYSDVVLGCGLKDIDEDYIEITMDFAKNIYKKVIVLDAGHGAHDPGAQHYGYDEKNLNLRILLECRELFKDTDVKVYYTRLDDSFLTLYERAAFAELVGADMFISVHHNSSWYTTVDGTSVHYSVKDTYTSLGGLTSEELSQRMLDNLVENLGTNVFGNGLIPQNFVVVRDSKAPAVLLEIGFMSNKEEMERMAKKKFAKKVAKTIVDTVLDIYEERS